MEKLSLKLIVILVAASLPATAKDFRLQNANLSKVKTEKWQCEFCPGGQGWSGNYSISGTYISDDEPAFNNNIDKNDEFGVDASVDSIYRDANKTVRISFNGIDGDPLNPGASLDAQLNYVSGNQWGLDYQRSPRYYGNSGMTPYVNQGSSNLSLPAGWIPDSNSQQMPLLAQSLVPLDYELIREKITLSYRFASDSKWQPRVSYYQEEKEGVEVKSGLAWFNGTHLPTPVNYTSSRLDAGVSYLSSNWLSDFAYQYMSFDNDDSYLSWQNPFDGSDRNYGLAPDNDYQSLTAKTRYQENGRRFSASLNYGVATQDQAIFDPTGLLSNNAFDGELKNLDFKLGFSETLPQNDRLRFSVAYTDRDNSTPRQMIAGRLTRTNDYEKTDARMAWQINQWSLFGFDIGAQMIQKNQPQQERRETDETVGFIKAKAKKLTNWQLHLDYRYGDRDGSEFEPFDNAANPQNQQLRRFNTADRIQHKINGVAGYEFGPAFGIDLSGFYAYDDYNKTQVGLIEGELYGYDLTLSGAYSSWDWQVYFSHSNNTWEQGGSVNLGAPNWFSSTESDTDQAGFIVNLPTTSERIANFVIQYDYSEGLVEQSLTLNTPQEYAYPDSKYLLHRFNMLLDFQLSDMSLLKTQLLYEHNNDPDYFYYNAQVDTLSNMLTTGPIGADYDVFYVGVGYQRRF